jgi:uncharacterized protein (TIGR02594 family)
VAGLIVAAVLSTVSGAALWFNFDRADVIQDRQQPDTIMDAKGAPQVIAVAKTVSEPAPIIEATPAVERPAKLQYARLPLDIAPSSAISSAVPSGPPIKAAIGVAKDTEAKIGTTEARPNPPSTRRAANIVVPSRHAETDKPSQQVRHRHHPPRVLRQDGGNGGAGLSLSVSAQALIAEARRYIGTNPTGRSSLWCGAFLDMVLRRTGHAGGGNLALGYAKYGARIAGPKIGAIVVLRRKGGGHVGIVTGIDSNGNPVVISGNHNRRVAISTYPRSRVVAYVVPRSGG